MQPLRVIRRWQKRVRALFRTEAVDSDLSEEMSYHLELETQKNLTLGMTPSEATRQAKRAFGAIDQHRIETREARFLSWLPDLSLDFKLGGRMLIKYPGLTLVGGLAMAFGIWAGALTFEMVMMLDHPTLPLPDGDRIVKLRNFDVQQNSEDLRGLHEYITWRKTLRSVTDLGAYRDVARNLVVTPGDARPVQVAEVTASAFRIAPARPVLGRVLNESDEGTGAPLVMVIGYEIWRTRFASDSNVIGRSVQIGDAFATVVGVMPKKFEFPVAHDLWMPLRTDAMDQAPRAGSDINIFGRLSAGVTLKQAQTELSAISRRTALEFPLTHQYLQAQINPYAKQLDLPPGNWVLTIAIPGFAVMLLVLVCSNVALLLFARAATRESELIVRSALGASRARIVAQLFAEALVLGAVAAVVGLAAASFVLRQWGGEFLEQNMGRLPFWYDPHLSPRTIVYAIGLTILAAVVAGVLPALKVTNGLANRLRQAAAGGGGLKFGGVWTAVIIIQVAFTTAFPSMVFIEQQSIVRVQTFDAGFPSEQYVAMMIEPGDAAVSSASVSTDAARREQGVRFEASLDALRQRVASEPGVEGVTFVDRLPRGEHRESRIELDDSSFMSAAKGVAGKGATLDPLRVVSTARVDAAYFDVLKAPMRAGRAFQSADMLPDAHVVIVDQSFVDQVLQGRNAIGRQIRFVSRADKPGESKPWHQIVGVVQELGMGTPTARGRAAGVYLPLVPGREGPTNMMVHVRGDPMASTSQLRANAVAVDPTLRLTNFQRVDQVTSSILWVVKLWLRITLFLTAIALLLSLAGIYAVMSFTVSRRTREIGIQVALGANARRVVVSIFKRPLSQVVIGVLAGGVLAGSFLTYVASCQDGVCNDTSGVITTFRVAMLLLYSLLILSVCLLACVVPTRRALSVQPVDALRAE